VPAADFAARDSWPRDTYVVPQYYFACDARNLEVTLSPEHSEYRWVRFGGATAMLRYDGNTTALYELEERLRSDDLPEPV
jgi:dATP pyrophosphohydrolase